ncbi:MAG: hypothetical protein M3N41_12640 [Acidobacteriota bacterium]|nr:hypothetical protein [Acidobacteriota bacterium]
MPPPLPPDDLLTLYKIAIDEYRFEVKLNWDRTVYYLTLNSGLVTIATGLLKLGNAPVINLLVAAIFFIGLCTAVIGLAAIRMGHKYYRRTIVKKTLLEDCLGLTKGLDDYAGKPTLAIGTTIGQVDQVMILNDAETYLGRKIRKGSITFWVLVILFFLCIMDLAGIAGSVWMYCNPQVPQAVQANPPII